MEDVSIVMNKRMELEQGREVECWSTLCDSDSNMEPLLQCSGCGVARYCGEVCKEKDRQKHGNFCQGIARWKKMKSSGSVIISGMDMDNDTLSKILSLTSTEHSSTKPKEQTFPSLKEHTSPGLKELNLLNLEEYTYPSLEEQNSHNLEEHILCLKEETSSNLKHTSLNLNKYTPLNLTKNTSPTLEEQSSPILEKDTSPSIDKSMCNYGSNDFNDSAEKSERFDPFKMEQDLTIDYKTLQKAPAPMNVESVICIMCKFMFPGGSCIEDISEVFFTHLKDDHGILHNHLDLLKCSMIPVTQRPPSQWTSHLPKSEKRRKIIPGC